MSMSILKMLMIFLIMMFLLWLIIIFLFISAVYNRISSVLHSASSSCKFDKIVLKK